MPSVFSKIVAGEISAHIIAETENVLAFLDVSPLVKGHVLVVPKKEVDYIFDLHTDMLAEIMALAKKIAPAIEKSIPCKRVGLAVIGLEVPHAHMHLLPINNADDLNFTRPKLAISNEELANIANLIKSNL